MLIEVVVNGQRIEAEVSPATRLLDLLRDRGLTGTKDSCCRGECGACTVLVDGRPVLACLTLAGRVDAEVTTVEGLASPMTALRASFADNGGLQCGYCTPGQIVNAAAIVAAAIRNSGSIPSRALDGNICRCTGSQPIGTAIAAHLQVHRGSR